MDTTEALRSAAPDDRGSAIISGVLISAIVVMMSLMAVNLSIHNQEATGRDRNRTQAVHAAEAGFDAVLSRLQSTSAVLMPCTLTGELATTPKARFSAKVTYYLEQNLTGTPLHCNDPGGPSLTPAGAAVNPGAAVVESAGSVGNVRRVMQGAVQLVPLMGQLNKALFSNESPDLNNNLEISSADGSADVYTNGDWLCPQSTVVHGTVFAQGRAALDNTCTVDGHLWVRGALEMKNHSVVGINAVTSRAAISLSQDAHVTNNAVAAGTCSGCTPARVGGSVSADRGVGNIPDPPVYVFPTISGSTAAWASTHTIRTFTDCATARTFIGNGSGITSPTLVRITAACDLKFANNSTVTLPADLAIITDGSITTERKVVFKSSSAARRTMHLIVPAEVEPTCDVPAGNGNITTSNNTDFENVDYFVYSPCKVQFSNNNPNSAGQVYGGEVVVENLFALQFKPIWVPGVPNEVVGYSSQLLYLREIVG